MRAAASGLAAILTLAACDGGGDPVEQALRETAAANHSAAVTYDEAVAPEGPSTRPAPTAAESAYAEVMIRGNREAITTARAVLSATKDPQIRRSAQAVVDSRTREIAELEAWAPALEEAE